MDDEVIRTAMGWRVGMLVLGVVLVAGVAVNLAKMVRGDWTWDGRGIAVAVALGVLGLLALAGNALVWTTTARVDQDANVLHFSTLGRHEARSLEAPTTVRIKRKDALPTGALVQQEVTVNTPGEAPLVMTTPFLGDVAALARQLQPALAANPELAADEHTRSLIEEPGRISRPRG